MALVEGSRIGDYEILSALGAGGMGKVFKVRNVISDRVEAMKVLLPDLQHEPELADRFMREIKVQASLQHSNIAALHTALRTDNQLLMIMELVEGVTLEQRLLQGPIPIHEAIDYVFQVLAALGYAHERGVTHRDIKPANMILMADGKVKLLDFGLAKLADGRRLTMTGTVMGSLYYMSPEQIKGVPTLDGRSDLYSVGVSFYEIVTGRKPLDGNSQFAVLYAHLEKTPAPPITLNTELSPRLNEIMMKALMKDPASRFQTADEFRDALAAVTQVPVSAVQSRHAQPVAGSAGVTTSTCITPVANADPSAHVTANANSKSLSALWLVAILAVLTGLVLLGRWTATSNSPTPPLRHSVHTGPSGGSPPAGETARSPVPSPVPSGSPRAATPHPVPRRPPRTPKSQRKELPARRTAGQEHSASRVVSPQVSEAGTTPLDLLILAASVPSVPQWLPLPEVPSGSFVIKVRHVDAPGSEHDGLLTIYGQDFTFQEDRTSHAFEGRTAALQMNCKRWRKNCTIELPKSGRRQILKIKKPDAFKLEAFKLNLIIEPINSGESPAHGEEKP